MDIPISHQDYKLEPEIRNIFIFNPSLLPHLCVCSRQKPSNLSRSSNGVGVEKWLSSWIHIRITWGDSGYISEQLTQNLWARDMSVFKKLLNDSNVQSKRKIIS